MPAGVTICRNAYKYRIVKQQTNEKAILEGLARNDSATVEQLYREHYNVIKSLIINNNGSIDEAKDIFQEALIVLYEKVKTQGFELHCQIRTYLYSVARRLWLKRLQQMSRYGYGMENADNVVPVEEDVDAQEERNLEFDMMNKAISSLGEPCKSLLEAYYVQKKSMHDIAEGFGYTNADNAKNQKYKCLMRLKKIFFSHYKTEGK